MSIVELTAELSAKHHRRLSVATVRRIVDHLSEKGHDVPRAGQVRFVRRELVPRVEEVLRQRRHI